MIAELEPLAACQVAERMRASDRREVLAVTPVQDLRQWARNVCALPGVALVVVANGEPVAMGGGIMMGHLAGVWFVATPRIEEPAVRVDCHRMALIAHRAMAQSGVRRCQAVALKDNAGVPPWLSRMGYRLEGEHPSYGRGGETFCTWGRILTNGTV
jgi:hypothetical protein